jgi:hypothetical protein
MARQAAARQSASTLHPRWEIGLLQTSIFQTSQVKPRLKQNIPAGFAENEWSTAPPEYLQISDYTHFNRLGLL